MLAKLLTVDQVKAVLISERNQVRRFSLSFLLFQNCISDDHLLTKTGLGQTHTPRKAFKSKRMASFRFVSFRFVSFHTTRQENEMIGRMEQRGMNVSKLMGQHGERDDRQMVGIILRIIA